MIAKTPEPPYYAVIFTSTHTNADKGYSEMAERMFELAALQPGYLGVESANGITVSYWESLEAIKKWKENNEHSSARKKGREDWYAAFMVRIAKVERDYDFVKS